MTAIPRSRLRGLYDPVRSFAKAQAELEVDHIERRFSLGCDVESMTGEKGKYCGTHVDENGNVFIMVTKEAGGKSEMECPGMWSRTLL